MGMWCDEGALKELRALQLALSGNPTVYGSTVIGFEFILFKSLVTEIRGNTWASLISILADFAGFAGVDTNGYFPYDPAIVGGEPSLVGDPVSWTKTAGAPNQDIYAWGIVGSTAIARSFLLFAKPLSAVRTLSDANPTIVIPPILGSHGI